MGEDRRLPLSSRINSLIEVFSPRLAAQREMHLAQRRVLAASAHYEGSGRTARARDFRVNRTDAVEANRADRSRLSWIARDMLRNNPRVVKAQRMLVNQIVGTGIVPTVVPVDPEDVEAKSQVELLIKQHCLTRKIDADGKNSLAGIQSLSVGTTTLSGESLIRIRRRSRSDGLPLPFQLQVMEPDYLNDAIDGDLSSGNLAAQGVEFSREGAVVAYHLFERHPGGRFGSGIKTRRVDAENIMHMFDVTRPGQVRGVSWYASVITLLHELQKYQDGQVKRQEVASMFAAIFKGEKPASEMKEDLGTLSAGAILQIGSDEDLTFSDPPGVDGYEPFMRGTDRTLAGGLGLTYEGFSGDYKGSNFSNSKMSRNDADPNIQRWQRQMVIPQFCQPLGDVIKESVELVAGIDSERYTIEWTPPRRPLVDPTREWPAAIKRARGSLSSLSSIIREMGEDPTQVFGEIAQDLKRLDDLGIVSDSDPRHTSASGGTQARAPGSVIPSEKEDDDE